MRVPKALGLDPAAAKFLASTAATAHSALPGVPPPFPGSLHSVAQLGCCVAPAKHCPILTHSSVHNLRACYAVCGKHIFSDSFCRMLAMRRCANATSHECRKEDLPRSRRGEVRRHSENVLGVHTGLGKRILEAGMWVGMSAAGVGGPLRSWRNHSLRGIFQRGASLRLQFPREDLGFVYDTPGCAVLPDTHMDPREWSEGAFPHRLSSHIPPPFDTLICGWVSRMALLARGVVICTFLRGIAVCTTIGVGAIHGCPGGVEHKSHLQVCSRMVTDLGAVRQCTCLVQTSLQALGLKIRLAR